MNNYGGGERYPGTGTLDQSNISENLINTLRAYHQTGLSPQDYQAMQAIRQMQLPTSRQFSNQLLDARNSAAEHRMPDVSQSELLQMQFMQQHQMQHMQQQPPHQTSKARAANVMPHKAPPSHYSNKAAQQAHPYHSYSMAQQSGQPSNPTSSMDTIPRSELSLPMTNSAASAQISSQPQRHSMDYSVQQHQQGRMARQPMSSQAHSQGQIHEPPSYSTSTVAENSIAAAPSRAAHANRYAQPKSMATAPQQARQLPQHASHAMSQEHSPREVGHGAPGQLPLDAIVSANRELGRGAPGQMPMDAIASTNANMHKDQPEPSHVHSQQTKPTQSARSYIPYKTDSMRKNKMEEEHEKANSQKSSNELNMNTVRQEARSNILSSQPSSVATNQPAPNRPRSARVPYKMDSMRQAQQDREKSVANPTVSSSASFIPAAVSQSASQIKADAEPQTSTANQDRNTNKPMRAKVSNVVPYKMSAMRSRAEKPPDPAPPLSAAPTTTSSSPLTTAPVSRPPISRHVPFKSAAMNRHMAPPLKPVSQPPDNDDNESSSSSSGDSSDSSSSSSSSDDSEDETPAKSEGQPAKTTVTPPVHGSAPVRTIPYKNPSNANRPPQNTIPTKKPMGKPLTLIKEKIGKQDPPPKPKTAGKPESMMQFMANNEIGSANKQGFDLSGSTMGAHFPTTPSSTPSHQPKVATPAMPQFEAISDSESPEKTELKKKRGRPPKQKGKDPSKAKESGSNSASPPKVPSTPTFSGGKFEMPPTPRFHDPPATPNPLSSTTASVPPTPSFAAAENTLFGSFTSPRDSISSENPNKSPSKRPRGRPPKKQTADEESPKPPKQEKPEQQDDIMDIVSNVTKNISTNLATNNDDATFELKWSGPLDTPNFADHLPGSGSVLPPYTPMSTPSVSTPFPPPSRTPFTTMGTPFAGGSMTPFQQPPSRTPLQSLAMSDLPTKHATSRHPPSDVAKKKRVGVKKKVRKRRPAVVEETEQMEEPESPPAFFSGLNDLPPMDVSGDSFQLMSRLKGADTQKEAEPTQERHPKTQATSGTGLFGAMLEPSRVADDKPPVAADDEAESRPPMSDVPPAGKKAKEGRRKKKPYPAKRPSKIKHLDPVFIADMEHISERIGNCCLYEEKQQDKQLPKYVSAFGQYALVHPPPPPPKTLPTPQSQITRPKPARGRRPQQRTANIKIKVKRGDIKPPSISESDLSPEIVPVVPEPTVPSEEVMKPQLDQPTITTIPATPEAEEVPKPAQPDAIPEKEKEEKKEETEEPKPINKTAATNYDSNLTAPEVAQKYYVPRSRIASKNISFNKAKGKKPKYGRGSSPRNPGTSPHLSESEADGERRHLPSRKSRPQQLRDDVLVSAEDVLSSEHDLALPPDDDSVPSPVVKRGRGRPPKSETEIPHTNLVRTNQLFLPLKKRHKMVEEHSADAMLPEPALGGEDIGGMDLQLSPHVDRPGSSQGRKRPASSLQREAEALAADESITGVVDMDAKRKRTGNLTALQAAMETAAQNKAKTDKQKRKNLAPAKKIIGDGNGHPDMDVTSDSDQKKAKETARKKPAKAHGKSQSLHYKKINKCVYSNGVKPLVPSYEPHSCICKKPLDARSKSCHEECLNRIMYIECTPQTCPCGDQCANMRIQKQTTLHGLEKIQTTDRGCGVKTTNLICSGEFILEYTGEVVKIDEFRKRMEFEYANDHHHYCLTLDREFVIDGYRMGNIGRFVNHSCEPNCEMQKWNVNGVYRIGLFALKDIRPGEELTYDYNFKAFNMDDQQKCHCGSANCREYMGGKTQSLSNLLKSKKKGNGIGIKFNPKDPVISHQRALMMPADEKRFVRAAHCFLLRNMMGHPPPMAPPKKPSGNQPLKMLLPYKTEGKLDRKEYRVPNKSETRDEEVIRCVCGMLREEGDMLMCDQCEVWQHCDCVGVKPDDSSRYLCDKCGNRNISGEVEMIPPPPDGQPDFKYFLSLENVDNGEMIHVAVGDAVFILPSNTSLGTYPFRIERLWKNPSGVKYVYGYFYYLPWNLPNRVDTTKKFYPNEVVQTKLYDILPLRNVKAHCYVIDEKSYCEGRPKDYTGEKDMFLCEYELEENLKDLKRIRRRRETEQVNKYHYAFSFLKKPIELKQYLSTSLKKAYDMKKEMKSDGAAKTRKVKKVRITSVEELVKNLSGKVKLALVDAQSVTKKNYPNLPNIRAKTPPKSAMVLKRSNGPSRLEAAKPSAQTVSARSSSSKKEDKSITLESKARPEIVVDKPSQLKGAQARNGSAKDKKPVNEPSSKSKESSSESASRSSARSRSAYSRGKAATANDKQATDASKISAETKTTEQPERPSTGKKTPEEKSSESTNRSSPEPESNRKTDLKPAKQLPERRTRRLSSDTMFAEALANQAAKNKSIDKKISDDKAKKAGEVGRKSRKPPEKKQASPKSRKGKLNDKSKGSKETNVPSPSVSKKRPASAMDDTESEVTPAPALRRGRSSSSRTLEVAELYKPTRPAKSSKTDTKPAAAQMKEVSSSKNDSKGKLESKNKVESRNKSDGKSKPDRGPEKIVKSAEGVSEDKNKADDKIMTDTTGKNEMKLRGKGKHEEEGVSENQMDDGGANNSKQLAIRLNKVDKGTKKPSETTPKVQITISPRDGDNSLSSTTGTARAPNVNLKTPIVVKRTEPGKAPTLSDLPSKASQQANMKSNVGKGSGDKTNPVNIENTAQIQKRGILKNAVAMPILKIAPVLINKPDEVVKAPVEAQNSETCKLTDKEQIKPVSKPEKTSIPEESPASPPVIVSEPAKLKKKVPIAEVLRRGKAAAAEKAAGKTSEQASSKIPDSSDSSVKAPLKPTEIVDKIIPTATPLQQSSEPASPTKSVAEIMSPTNTKTPQGPKVIPLIPLSPTSIAQDDSASGPLSIPLSPTKINESSTPSSPSQTLELSYPSSPTSKEQNLTESQPPTIPLSPTTLRSIRSREDLSRTPASPDEPLAASKECITPIVPTIPSELSVGLQPPIEPSFLTMSTDEDDSDTEPMLSIAEDICTPSKDGSKDKTTTIQPEGGPTKAEYLKIKPIPSATEAGATLKTKVSVASVAESSKSTVLPPASPDSSSDSIENLRSVASTATELSLASDALSTSVVPDSKTSLKNTPSVASLERGPASPSLETDTVNLPINTSKSGVATSALKPGLLTKLPSAYIPLIPCDNMLSPSHSAGHSVNSALKLTQKSNPVSTDKNSMTGTAETFIDKSLTIESTDRSQYRSVPELEAHSIHLEIYEMDKLLPVESMASSFSVVSIPLKSVVVSSVAIKESLESTKDMTSLVKSASSKVAESDSCAPAPLESAVDVPSLKEIDDTRVLPAVTSKSADNSGSSTPVKDEKDDATDKADLANPAQSTTDLSISEEVASGISNLSEDSQTPESGVILSCTVSEDADDNLSQEYIGSAPESHEAISTTKAQDIAGQSIGEGCQDSSHEFTGSPDTCAMMSSPASDSLAQVDDLPCDNEIVRSDRQPDEVQASSNADEKTPASLLGDINANETNKEACSEQADISKEVTSDDSKNTLDLQAEKIKEDTVIDEPLDDQSKEEQQDSERTSEETGVQGETAILMDTPNASEDSVETDADNDAGMSNANIVKPFDSLQPSINVASEEELALHPAKIPNQPLAAISHITMDSDVQTKIEKGGLSEYASKSLPDSKYSSDDTKLAVNQDTEQLIPEPNESVAPVSPPTSSRASDILEAVEHSEASLSAIAGVEKASNGSEVLPSFQLIEERSTDAALVIPRSTESVPSGAQIQDSESQSDDEVAEKETSFEPGADSSRLQSSECSLLAGLELKSSVSKHACQTAEGMSQPATMELVDSLIEGSDDLGPPETSKPIASPVVGLDDVGAPESSEPDPSKLDTPAANTCNDSIDPNQLVTEATQKSEEYLHDRAIEQSQSKSTEDHNELSLELSSSEDKGCADPESTRSDNISLSLHHPNRESVHESYSYPTEQPLNFEAAVVDPVPLVQSACPGKSVSCEPASAGLALEAPVAEEQIDSDVSPTDEPVQHATTSISDIPKEKLVSEESVVLAEAVVAERPVVPVKLVAAIQSVEELDAVLVIEKPSVAIGPPAIPEGIVIFEKPDMLEDSVRSEKLGTLEEPTITKELADCNSAEEPCVHEIIAEKPVAEEQPPCEEPAVSENQGLLEEHVAVEEPVVSNNTVACEPTEKLSVNPTAAGKPIVSKEPINLAATEDVGASERSMTDEQSTFPAMSAGCNTSDESAAEPVLEELVTVGKTAVHDEPVVSENLVATEELAISEETESISLSDETKVSEKPVATEVSPYKSTEEPGFFDEPTIPDESASLEESAVPRQPDLFEQPNVPEQPDVPEQPAVSGYPAAHEEQIVSKELAAHENLIDLEQQAVSEQLAALEDSAAHEEPIVLQEQVISQEPGVSDEPAVPKEPTATDNTIPENLAAVLSAGAVELFKAELNNDVVNAQDDTSEVAREEIMSYKPDILEVLASNELPAHSNTSLQDPASENSKAACTFGEEGTHEKSTATILSPEKPIVFEESVTDAIIEKSDMEKLDMVRESSHEESAVCKMSEFDKTDHESPVDTIECEESIASNQKAAFLKPASDAISVEPDDPLESPRTVCEPLTSPKEHTSKKLISEASILVDEPLPIPQEKASGDLNEENKAVSLEAPTACREFATTRFEKPAFIESSKLGLEKPAAHDAVEEKAVEQKELSTSAVSNPATSFLETQTVSNNEPKGQCVSQSSYTSADTSHLLSESSAVLSAMPPALQLRKLSNTSVESDKPHDPEQLTVANLTKPTTNISNPETSVVKEQIDTSVSNAQESFCKPEELVPQIELQTHETASSSHNEVVDANKQQLPMESELRTSPDVVVEQTAAQPKLSESIDMLHACNEDVGKAVSSDLDLTDAKEYEPKISTTLNVTEKPESCNEISKSLEQLKYDTAKTSELNTQSVKNCDETEPTLDSGETEKQELLSNKTIPNVATGDTDNSPVRNPEPGDKPSSSGLLVSYDYAESDSE